MSEARLQFSVGLMVLVALSIGTALVIRFGDLQKDLKEHYVIHVQLETAGGLYPSAPVLMNGLSIGHVREIRFATDHGVLATIEIRKEIPIRSDSLPIVSRSLLGETVIEFVPGVSEDVLQAEAHIAGQGAADPLAALQRLEGRAGQVLDALVATSQEWQKVGQNVNGLMDTNRGNLNVVIERAAESLHQFSQTMMAANEMIGEANKVLGDPRSQMALKQTLDGLPGLVEETRLTIASTRIAVESMNRNFVNLSQVTEPVGQRGPVMVAKLESSLANLDGLLNELNRVAQAVNQPNGTINKLASDPSLYDNLDRSAQSMAVLLKNLEPVLRDMREFSDKVARNPELLGVGGAFRPSSGLRDTEVLNPPATAPAGRAAVTSGRTTYRSQN
ncbi:MCE family protein [bacterium]|nr:MCE family protein [bacterium]